MHASPCHPAKDRGGGCALVGATGRAAARGGPLTAGPGPGGSRALTAAMPL
ncbi:hypothetical protein [Streptomyces sp. NRRL F-2664]|uniref:hypothetical protein n=1 Tax=Streptomyces sp. NRRL F-2664 TaxID=1463842 RepID=UPI000AE03C25|nr:hypothetical protein [Streptomyces sp. NRRL F-2664]